MILKKILEKQKLIFPVLDVLLNGFNYGFHIYTSWYLTKEAYASLNALLALAALIMVTGVGMQNYSAGASSGLDLKKTSVVTVNPLLITTLPVLLMALFSVRLMSATGGGIPQMILILSILYSHSLLSSYRGIIQGQGKFLQLNISFYTEVGGKIVFILIFLPLSPTPLTALISILTGYLLALIHIKYVIKTMKMSPLIYLTLKDFFRDSEVLRFILCQFFLYSFFTVDMIIVNNNIPKEAHLFAVVQKLGMIQFFVSGSLLTIFLPELSDKSIPGTSIKKRWYRFLLLLLAALVLLQIFYRTLLPFLIPWLFNETYSEAADYTALGGLVFALLVINNFMVTSLLAFRHRSFIRLFYPAVIIYVLLLLRAQDLNTILISELLLYTVMALIFTVIILKFFKTEKGFNGSDILKTQHTVEHRK